jgi:O-antigen/teichoic acid export membrane protein
MAAAIKRTLGSLVRLAVGEAGSRLASFILFAYISRRIGVEFLGFVALAQTAANYVVCGTDQGLRYIGARLVARDAGSSAVVIRHLLKKRFTLALLSVTLGCAYALFGPLPGEARPYVLCFVLAVLPYALALDWLAWGLNHLGWLGGWRAGVSTLFAVGTVVGIHFTGNAFASITIANGASTILGAVVLWLAWFLLWRRREKHQPSSPTTNDEIIGELRWTPVLMLGFAVIFNQMFKNFDTVMLGAMSTAAEVGRYAAASKILFLLFSGYYLLMQALYPQLSRLVGENVQRLFIRALIAVAALGILIAIATAVLAPFILRVVYGSDLNATRLLRILSLSVPFDFCVALLGTIFVSHGRDRLVLVTGAVSAGLNIAMNLFLIPRMQAEGAAWATLGSYIVLLATFLALMPRLKVQTETSGVTVVEPEAVVQR